MDFNGKTVIITGANSGIGKEIALMFGERKANVVVNYIVNEEAASDVVQHIHNLGGSAIKIYGDVTKLNDCENIIKKTKENWSVPSILTPVKAISPGCKLVCAFKAIENTKSDKKKKDFFIINLR